MPARATQPSTYPGGRALIEVIGPPERFPDPVEICLLHQMGGVDKAKHLDPRTPDDPWKSAVFWFQPEAVARADGRLSFDLDHGVTAHLRPNIPYVMRVRGAGGTVVEERLVWKAIRGKSAPPVWTPPKGPEWPGKSEGEPAGPAEPQQPQESQEPEIPIETGPRPTGSVGTGKAPPWGAIAAGVLVLAALAGGGWFLMQNKDPVPAPVAEAAKPAPLPAPLPTTVEEARRLVQQDTPAGDAYAAGERFRQARALDGAFLLFRHAAERGNAEAAVALGAMYDPATHSAETSPLPAANPTQAAEWYRRAAEAGNAEAQFRYGRLLASGKTDDPQGPDAGLAWLRKAADQGHAQAKEALPK
ncbi:tetratricopeptide repeat protein [Azospirillum argentinense]